jgi:hypothetical protein
MNERIQAIFQGAGGWVEIDEKGNISTYSHEVDPEVFARAIIRECNLFTDLCTRQLILNHFGMKE